MGMEVHPFDRLAKAIDEMQRSGVAGEDFFVQLGSCSYQPSQARFVRYLSFDQVCENIRSSSVVITHAGAGSTLVCIQQGKHPIVVPRLSRLGEHVDDHQVVFAERLGRGGFATAVGEMEALPAAIASVRGRSAPEHALGRATELTSWLEGFWQGLARKGTRRPGSA